MAGVSGARPTRLKRYGFLGGMGGVALLALAALGSLVYPGMPGWLVLFLLGAALLLCAAYVHLDALARALARRQTRYGLNVLAMAILLLGVIALVEYFSARYNRRLDLTEGRRHTLSPQTVKVARELKKPVKAVAFYRAPGPGVAEDRRTAEDLLRQYADLSSHFRYEFVDPDRDPGMARRYKISLYGTVVLETPEEAAAPGPPGGDPPAKASPPPAPKAGPPGAVAERAMREEQITDLSEERLTNTLVKITRPGRRAIYFVQGHGEGNLAERGRTGFGLLRQEVERANYVVQELFLPREKGVPQDTAAVVLLGPQKDPAPEELALLEAYLARGGKLLVLADPFTAPALTPFLARYGLTLGEDVVVDRLQHAFGGNLLTPVINRYGDHPITRGLRGTASVFPYVRSVTLSEKAPPGVTLGKLAESGPFDGSWAETDRSEFTRGTIQFNEGKDRRGPVPIAAAATIDARKAAAGDPGKPGEPAGTRGGAQKAGADAPREPQARLVVFGSSGFASNVYLGAFGNRDLFLNALSWLAEEEDLIAIRPKDPKAAPLFLTAAQANLFWAIPVLLMPLTIAAVGLGVFLRRRRSP